MKTEFRKSFEKDVQKLRDPQVLAKVKAVILSIEQAESLDELSNVKKLTTKGSFYRIRIGDYRIGIIANFSRCSAWIRSAIFSKAVPFKEHRAK